MFVFVAITTEKIESASFSEMPASVVRLAGVRGGNLLDWYLDMDCLVGDEGFQLEERPCVPIQASVRFGCLSLPGILPNTTQVLKPNTVPRPRS